MRRGLVTLADEVELKVKLSVLFFLHRIVADGNKAASPCGSRSGLGREAQAIAAVSIS
jgi:hypothetical protein